MTGRKLLKNSMDDWVILGIPLLITRLYQMRGVRTLQSGGYTMYDDVGTGEFLASEDEITGQEQGGGTVLVTPGCPCTKSGGMFCLCGVSQLGEYKAAEVNHVKFLVFDHFS